MISTSAPASAPAFNGSTVRAPKDVRYLHEGFASQASSASLYSGFGAHFVAKMLAKYHTLDVRRVPRVQSLLLFPRPLIEPRPYNCWHTQCATHSLDVSCARSHWSCYYGLTGLRLRVARTRVHANRDYTHDLLHLVDDLFAAKVERQIERTNGVQVPPYRLRQMLYDNLACPSGHLFRNLLAPSGL